MSFLFWLAVAVTPLSDPALEARAQGLEREIRCLQCENEPISQSTSEMAVDMRVRVRDMISDGATDAQVRGFFRERFGDFVLLRPAFTPMTWALWGAPILLLLAALLAALSLRGRGRKETFLPETDER
jgi:cytochrome c-type biogenesis protein CcmH